MSPYTPNFDLSPFNTFGLNAVAAQGIEINTLEQLEFIYAWSQSNKPWMVIGEGANILFCDNYGGLAVINRLRGRRVTDSGDSWTIEVSAGENWPALVQWLVDQGIGGVENLALIPGTVGGAPVQNIGAYGAEFEQVCQSVHYFDMQTGRHQTVDASACQFGYRDSIFKKELKGRAIITAVTLTTPKRWQPKLRYGPLRESLGDSPSPSDVFNAICAVRTAKLPDPRVHGNAGSFFKNPVVTKEKAEQLSRSYPHMPMYQEPSVTKLAAGWLIDQCGLKGTFEGGACVHQEQALVIINKGGATSNDILRLAKMIREHVMTKFSVALVPEVRFIGKLGELDPVVTIEALR